MAFKHLLIYLVRLNLKIECVFSVRRNSSVIEIKKLLQLEEAAHLLQKGLCGSCGIAIPSSVGVGYVDGNAANSNPENIVAVCKVCEALLNGGRLNKTESCGWLIYAPMLEQVDIIRLAYARAGICKKNMTNKTAISLATSKLKVDEIFKLKTPVKSYLGFDDTDSLADFLKAAKPFAYQNRRKGLGPIRWFPDLDGEALRPYLNSYIGTFLDESVLKEMTR